MVAGLGCGSRRWNGSANHVEATKHVFSSGAVIGRGLWLGGSLGRGEKARRGGRGAVGGREGLGISGRRRGGIGRPVLGGLGASMSRICSRAQCRFQQSAGGLRCREWRGKDWALRSGPRWGPEAAGARSIPSGSSAHDAVHANQLRDVHGTGGKREQQLSAISMAMLQLKPLKGRGSGGSKSSKTEPPEHASAGNRWFSDLSEGKVGSLPNGRRRWVSRAHLVVEIGTGAWEKIRGADLAPRGEFVQAWLWIGDAKTSWKSNLG